MDHKLKLLGHYLTLTSRSAGFSTHSEGFDEQGFSLRDPCGLKADDLDTEGGSVEDLKGFQTLAKEHAFIFNKGPTGDRDIRLSSLNKRKITDFFQTTPQKMSKKERTDKNFRDEIEDVAGLEVNLKNSFVNFKMIHIDRLSVSPNLFLQKNEGKVRDLAETMESQFDPTQVILTVCPKDLDQYEKADTIDQLDFLVIAGQHRLAALKGLDKVGKLENLAGIKNKKIPSYVCKTKSAASENYANIRANDTASKYKDQASNEDLIFVYSGLVKASEKPIMALDAVKRICYSRQTHPEDLAALLKIIEWPVDILEKLMVVLNSFKKFQTMDAPGYGAKSRLRNKVAKSLTQTHFRQLGRCKPEFFAECCEKVLRNELSLKDLIEESHKENELEKTFHTVSQLARHEDINTLKEKYPDKFNDSRLLKYNGSDISVKKGNDLGKLLTNYVKSVIEGREVVEQIVLEEIQSVFDLSGSRLEVFDVVIYRSGLKSWDLEFIKCLADFAGCSRKSQLSVMIIIPSEAQLYDVLQAVETWRANPEFKIHQILFKRSTGAPVIGKVQENVAFSILFGKTNIFKDDLNTLQSGTVQSELIKVVKSISPPSSKVAYITGAGQEILKIHDSSEVSDIEVTYFATKKDLDRFARKFLTKVRVELEKHVDDFEPVQNCDADNQEEELGGEEEELSDEDDDLYGGEEEVVDKDEEEEANSDEDPFEKKCAMKANKLPDRITNKNSKDYETDEEEFALGGDENLKDLNSLAGVDEHQESDGIIRQASTSSKKYVNEKVT